MAQPVGAFTPETAKIILDVVRYLRNSGYIIDQPGRGNQFIPPQAPIYIRNDTGEEIPPFACLQVTGTVDSGGQNYVTVDKPVDTTGEAGWYLFNGIAPIATGDYGIGHDGPLVRMLTDGSTVTCGDSWQPQVDSFEVAPGGSIFSAVGEDDIETDVMRGFIVAAGGGGGDSIQGIITSVRNATSGDEDYTGLKIATMNVVVAPCGRTELVGTAVEVIDHSLQILDLSNAALVGFYLWASEGVALSRDPEADNCQLTPCHWAAVNRSCIEYEGTLPTCEEE